jgi:hypothetical protein
MSVMICLRRRPDRRRPGRASPRPNRPHGDPLGMRDSHRCGGLRDGRCANSGSRLKAHQRVEASHYGDDAMTTDNEPATVQRKTNHATAIGAGAGILVGLAIALPVALTTNQTSGGAAAQTVTSTVTSTVTVPVSATAAPTATVAPTSTSTQQSTYSGPGAFAVGSAPTGGLTAAIPPGRYRAEVNPGSSMGSVLRCSDLLCGPGPASDLIAGTPVFAGGSILVQILPTDAAVYLLNVTVTRVE